MESSDADGNISFVEDPSQNMKSIAFELHVGDEQIVTFESEAKILDTQNVPDATRIVEILPDNSASIVQFQPDPGTGQFDGTSAGEVHLHIKKEALQAAAPVEEVTMLPDEFRGTIQVGTTFINVVPNEKLKKVEMQTKKKAKLEMRKQRLASEIVPKNKPVSTGVWFETQEEMTQYIQEFEDKTLTKYCIRCVKHNWNQGNFEVSDYPSIKQLHWQTSDKSFMRGVIPFDGHPYIILTAKVLICHQGKNYQAWENNKVNKELRAKFGQIREKTRKYTVKKIGCPAKIDVKKILKFPGFKLHRNSRKGKEEFTRKFREYLQGGGIPETKVHYVITKPSAEDHEGHPLNGEARIYLPVHPILKRAIVQLMINAHVRSPAEMMKLLGAFRASHFADRAPPRETDSRWYPKIGTLNNIMSATKHRLTTGRMHPVTGEWSPVPSHRQGRFSKKAPALEDLRMATMTSTLDLGEVTEVTTSGGITVGDGSGLQDVVHAQPGRFPEAVSTAEDFDDLNLAGLTETEIAARNLISIQSGVPRVAKNLEALQRARAPGSSARLLPASAPFRVSGVTRAGKKAPDASTLGVKIHALLEKMGRFSETCTDLDTLQRVHANCQRNVRDLKAGTPRDVLKTLEPPNKKRKVKREELQEPFSHQHHLQHHQPQPPPQRQDEFDVTHVYHYPQALSGL